MDSVLRAVPGPDAPKRLFVPVGVPAQVRAKLRQEGWQTVAALADAGDVPAEARRLGADERVSGRPIVRADDPPAAARRILDEMAG